MACYRLVSQSVFVFKRTLLWQNSPSLNDHSENSIPIIDIRHPVILGLDFSRPSSVIEMSDNYCYEESCHPAYIYPEYFQLANNQLPKPKYEKALRFDASFDMFSLGCVLLEIGLWRTLTSLWNDQKDPSLWVDRLCQKYVLELAGRCGSKYSAVVLDLLMRANPMDSLNSPRTTMTNFELVQLLEQLNI